MSEKTIVPYPATIAPYAHPTTVVIVDDNDLFLNTLDLRMPADMACIRFHNPRHAMERVNQKLALRPIAERCFSTPSKSLHWSDSVIRFDLGLIEQEIRNLQRFRRVSVVIADYYMPAMDGLKLLTSIADPMVKTVLMSGIGDEKLALDAFNDELIDRYVPKNRETTLDMAVDYTLELQREYFLDQQRAIQESLSLNPPELLGDPAVLAHFSELRKRHRFVEHYLVGDPPGFVFVTAKGVLHRLIVLSDTEVAEQAEYAAQHDAPPDVVSALSSRSRIGFFSERAETYGDELYPWRDFLYAPTRLEGDRTWWSALVSDPPAEIDFSPVESSFAAYLDEIDAVL
jgi:CheY-like chemotaxis protein